MSLYRTWMFVPGNQQRRIDKVKGLNADIIIYDLEDAVPITEKNEARKLVSKAIEDDSDRQNFVRVNDLNTDYCMDDIKTVLNKGLKGLIIPKTNQPQDIHQVETILNELEEAHNIEKGSIKIVPLIETALGVHNSYEIAKSSERIKQIAFGSMDFSLDINATLTQSGTEVLYARSQLVVASRAARIDAPIDAVYLDIKDSEGLKNETEFVKQLGFQGKLVVHPNQIEVVNKVFIPNEEEVEEARKIVSAFEEAESQGLAAVQVNGKMVDYPVVDKAKKVCAKAEMLGL